MTRPDHDHTGPLGPAGTLSEPTRSQPHPGPGNDPPHRAGQRLWQRLRRGRVFAYLAIAGPGLIAANAGNDAAGIATYSSAGSQFIYRTLFFMVLVTIALVLVQEMAVRLGTYTGKGLAALIREQFSLRLTGLALFCVLLANTGLVVSEFAGIGAAFELVGVSRYLVIPIFAVVIWALVLFGSYRYAERIFLVFSLAFLAYPIAAILGHPRWSEVAANLLLPHFVASRDFVLLGVALIGTTVSPYMQLYAAAGVVDRGATPTTTPTPASTRSAERCSPASSPSPSSSPPAPPSAAKDPWTQPSKPPKRYARWPVPAPSCYSPSGCSAPARWPARWSPCRAPMRSAKPSASSARCPAGSGKRPCSWACSPSRCSSVPRSR